MDDFTPGDPRSIHIDVLHVPVLTPQLRSLIGRLNQAGCVELEGNRTNTTQGYKLPYYFNIREIEAGSEMMGLLSEAYINAMNGTGCDAVAAVPNAVIPLVTRISSNTPFDVITVKKNPQIGEDPVSGFIPEEHEGKRVLIIDDKASTGGSILRTAKHLRDKGMKVSDVLVCVDGEEGALENLRENGITLHSVMTASQLMHDITDSRKYKQIMRFASLRRRRMIKEIEERRVNSSG